MTGTTASRDDEQPHMPASDIGNKNRNTAKLQNLSRIHMSQWTRYSFIAHHVFIWIIMETMEGRRQDPRPLCMTRFKSHHSFSEATTSPEAGI